MTTLASDPFTLGQGIPKAELESSFVKAEEIPHGNPAFAYAMVVPGDFLQLGIAVQDGRMHADQPKLLASFLGPKVDNGNALLQLSCQGLVKEIAAGAWLKHFLHRADTVVDAFREDSALQAGAVATRTSAEGVRLTMRLAAQIHGNRLFLVQGLAPSDQFERYAEAFGVAVATFRPAHAMAQPSVEARSTQTLDGAVTFQTPFSWLYQNLEAPEGLAGLNLYSLAGDGKPTGAIKALAVRRSLTRGKKGLDLPALLISEFTKTGVKLGAVVSDQPMPVPAPLANGRLKILTVTLGAAPRLHNLLVASVDLPSHHVLLGLLTCAPKEDFYVHSVNLRAFQIALETLQPGKSS